MSEYQLTSSIKYENFGGIYRIIRPEIPFVGLCGYWWQIIRAIYKYPNDKYYIFVGNPSGENVWDFYYKQPHINMYPQSNEILAETGIIFDEESEFVDLYPCMRKLKESDLQDRKTKFFNITSKYFVPLTEIQKDIDQFINTYFQGKKVLGFHFRGTDHPDARDVSNSFPIIDSLLETHDLIFTSSDEVDIIKKLSNRYGIRLLQYNSTTRSDSCDFQMQRGPDTEHTHAFRYNALVNWSRNNSGYKIGKDVVMETHLLSKTNYLLCSANSNVNYFIRALNVNLPYKIIYTPQL